MTTWVPTCAPKLWGHPSWECPSWSRAMHAAYPWNVTLMGLSTSSGSLLVLRPHGPGFSLLITDVWSGIHFTWPNSAIWVTDVRCHIALTLLPRTHQHILVIDAWPLLGNFAHVPCKTLARAARGTQLTWPPLLAVNDVRGLVGT